MREPKNTCPFIDQSIEAMKENWEEIRAKNQEIREWGQYWLDEYEKLESSSNSEIESLNDTIKDLQDQIRELKDQLIDARNIVA
jgi:chromosome segregation ATPase